MVSIIQRMRRLRTLLAIRVGPGAAILPPEVTRLHMDFAVRIDSGHRGARHFWRKILPRLKYHNPSIPMTVKRTADQSGPSTLTVHFASPSATANTPPGVSSTTSPLTSTGPVAEAVAGAPTERTATINMKDRQESEILGKLMEITKAKPVRPTAEELQQIRELEEQKAKSDAVRVLSLAEKARRQREKDILSQARGEVENATS